MACKTLINEVMQIINAAVEVAWIGASFNFLNAGIRKTPPPRPKPLKTPANKLLTKVYFIFWFMQSSPFQKSSSPRVTEGAYQISKRFLLLLKKSQPCTKRRSQNTQQKIEQELIPKMLGNFSEPFMREMQLQQKIISMICLNILILSQLQKGLTAVCWIIWLALRSFCDEISNYYVSFLYPQTNLPQILGRELKATPTIINISTKLGSNLFRKTPIKAPMNMMGSITKAQLQCTIGSLLSAVCIWLITFPNEAPNTQAKLIRVAFLGSMSKNRIMTTTFGPPPPKPASELSPATTIIRMMPMSRLIAKEDYYYIAPRLFIIEVSLKPNQLIIIDFLYQWIIKYSITVK